MTISVASNEHIQLVRDISPLLAAAADATPLSAALSGPLTTNSIVRKMLGQLSSIEDRRESSAHCPQWLDRHWQAVKAEALRASLAVEASSITASWPYYLSPGPAATAVASNESLSAWARKCFAGTHIQVAEVSYVVYNQEWQRCPLHLDDPTRYAINALICLEKTHPSRDALSSELYLLEDHHLVQRRLEPGDVFLFHSSTRPHLRSALEPGATVVLLSIGFSVRAFG